MEVQDFPKIQFHLRMSFISLVTHIYKTHIYLERKRYNQWHFPCGISHGLLSNLSWKKEKSHLVI